jgi:hypothetical protein
MVTHQGEKEFPVASLDKYLAPISRESDPEQILDKSKRKGTG